VEDFEALRGLKAMVGKRVQFDEEAWEALRKEIAVAERNIAEGKALIAQQRQIISSLAINGADISRAVAATRDLLEKKRLHEQHYHSLLIKLAKLNKKPR
jgi:hypothetical protein